MEPRTRSATVNALAVRGGRNSTLGRRPVGGNDGGGRYWCGSGADMEWLRKAAVRWREIFSMAAMETR
jgi:hypothetical protein